MISELGILILVHFVSDWFLQPEKWANNKKDKFKYLLFHSIQYTIIFIPFLYILKINLLWALWIFGMHLILDNRKFLKWWNTKVMKKKKIPSIVELVQDQTLHIITLAIIFLF